MTLAAQNGGVIAFWFIFGFGGYLFMGLTMALLVNALRTQKLVAFWDDPLPFFSGLLWPIVLIIGLLWFPVKYFAINFHEFIVDKFIKED